MLRDVALSAGNYIVRLVYSFNKTTESTNQEIIDKYLNQDQTYQVNYYLANQRLNNSLRFTRNICLDACKALGLKCENCMKPLNELLVVHNSTSKAHSFISLYFKVYQISLIGEGRIENASLREQSDSPDFEWAQLAADYLIESQNKTSGGWAVKVNRSFGKESKFLLRPNWYSSMAQGHAISLLCRVYRQTKSYKYFHSASKALDIFFIKSENGGVQANFMNTSLVWYEEYPTEPTSLFVLNGFLYSLFGLYDFIDACGYSRLDEDTAEMSIRKAEILLKNGLNSLGRLLSLFDSGSRSFYDLRHFSEALANPNLARWDYHMLHVSQIYHLLNLIEANKSEYLFLNEPKLEWTLKTIAKRWFDYSKGKWNENSQIKNF